MIRACEGQRETAMWLICHKPTLAKYGIGFVKPAPMPMGKFLRNGYLIKGDTLAELAMNAGLDAPGLQQTVKEFDVGAAQGKDPAFGRGRTSFNRCLADPKKNAECLRCTGSNRPVFCRETSDGGHGHVRWHQDQRVRKSSETRRSKKSIASMPWVMIAPASWAATIRAPVLPTART